jgi:hypothetical protein
MSFHFTAPREGHRHDSPQEAEPAEAHQVNDQLGLSLSKPPEAIGHHPPLADFLASPIRTLCESINDPQQDFISDIDIVEAYSVLCARIRSRRGDVADTKTREALSGLEADLPFFVLCISRDVQRVLPNPFDSAPRHRQSVSQSYDADRSVYGDDRPPAIDHMLCQNALRLMSDLFLYPALYSMFSRELVSVP